MYYSMRSSFISDRFSATGAHNEQCDWSRSGDAWIIIIIIIIIITIIILLLSSPLLPCYVSGVPLCTWPASIIITLHTCAHTKVVGHHVRTRVNDTIRFNLNAPLVRFGRNMFRDNNYAVREYKLRDFSLLSRSFNAQKCIVSIKQVRR
jgi:hypothetical protein